MKYFRPENLLLDDASHVKIADFGRLIISLSIVLKDFLSRLIEYYERRRIVKNILWFTELCCS